MKTREELDNIEKEFLDHFTEEEIEKFRRYIELNTRVNILKQMVGELSELDELLSNSKGVGATSLIIARQWLVEMTEELNKLQEEVSMTVYWRDLKYNVTNMKNQFDKAIDTNLPKLITKEFLRTKFGEDDSPSKDAMTGVCTEAVEYFVASIRNGNFIKAADEQIESSNQ